MKGPKSPRFQAEDSHSFDRSRAQHYYAIWFFSSPVSILVLYVGQGIDGSGTP